MFTAGKRLAALLALALMLVWPAVSLAANTTVSAQVCANAFAATTLTSADPSPTANASAALTGTAEPASTVNLTVGGVVQATLTAGPGGQFAAAVPLAIGDNIVVAAAGDGPFCGHVSTSPSVLIHRDLVAPDAPSVSAPPSGTVTTDTSALVEGSAEHNATLDVLVNGRAAATLTLGPDGLFSVTVPLSLGANTIQARATNSAGASPLSAAVAVTRQPATVQSPAQPRTATPAAPRITSPTSGTATSASNVTVQLAGRPGATAVATNNGVEAARLVLPTGGTAEVSVPLLAGDNLITVTVSGVTSPAVLVHRDSLPPSAPIIIGPTDGRSTDDSFIDVSGQATPGSRVIVYVGAAPVATATADESGYFAARVNLRVGLNLIYASIALPDGQTLKSSLVQVNRNGTALEDTAYRTKAGLTALVTVPAAAAVLTAQGVGEVLGAVASSPSSTVMVLSFTAAASTAGTGLLGLELVLLLPGLVRAATRRLPARAVRGRVLDAVTGQPLGLAKISLDDDPVAHTVSGFSGQFAVPAAETGTELQVQASRPGFQPSGLNRAGRELTISLEPSAARFSRLGVAADFLIGVVSWLSMAFSAGLGIYLVLHNPSLTTWVVAVLALGILVINIFSIATQPRYRWGRLTDLQGIPISGAVLKLAYCASGAVVSTYRTDRSGRYTLHAPSRGRYRLTVQLSESSPMHEEAITVRHRGSYLGFGLKLPR